MKERKMDMDYDTFDTFIGQSRTAGICPLCSRAYIGGDSYADEFVSHLELDAQVLYDLRTLTGNCSGSELSELFVALGLGPSPSGREKVSGAALLEAESLTPSHKSFSAWITASPASAEAFADGCRLEPVGEIIDRFVGLPLSQKWKSGILLHNASRLVSEATDLAYAS